MTKSETIRILHREGCSVSEIALAVGYKEKVIKVRLARPRPMAKDRIPWAFNGWRGWPISDKVVSF